MTKKIQVDGIVRHCGINVHRVVFDDDLTFLTLDIKIWVWIAPWFFGLLLGMVIGANL